MELWLSRMLFKALGGIAGSVKKTSLFLGGSINSEIQSGCCVGWIFNYCQKELEHGCGRTFPHSFLFSFGFEICIPFNKIPETGILKVTVHVTLF